MPYVEVGYFKNSDSKHVITFKQFYFNYKKCACPKVLTWETQNVGHWRLGAGSGDPLSLPSDSIGKGVWTWDYNFVEQVSSIFKLLLCSTIHN